MRVPHALAGRTVFWQVKSIHPWRPIENKPRGRTMICRSTAKPFLSAILTVALLGATACRQKPENTTSQSPQKAHLKAYFVREPWYRGTQREAHLNTLALQTN